MYISSPHIYSSLFSRDIFFISRNLSGSESSHCTNKGKLIRANPLPSNIHTQPQFAMFTEHIIWLDNTERSAINSQSIHTFHSLVYIMWAVVLRNTQAIPDLLRFIWKVAMHIGFKDNLVPQLFLRLVKCYLLTNFMYAARRTRCFISISQNVCILKNKGFHYFWKHFIQNLQLYRQYIKYFIITIHI